MLDLHPQISLFKTELLLIPAGFSVHYIGIQLSSYHHCETGNLNQSSSPECFTHWSNKLPKLSFIRTRFCPLLDRDERTYSLNMFLLSVYLRPLPLFLGPFSKLLLPHEGGTEGFCPFSRTFLLDPLCLGLYVALRCFGQKHLLSE